MDDRIHLCTILISIYTGKILPKCPYRSYRFDISLLANQLSVFFNKVSWTIFSFHIPFETFGNTNLTNPGPKSLTQGFNTHLAFGDNMLCIKFCVVNSECSSLSGQHTDLELFSQ